MFQKNYFKKQKLFKTQKGRILYHILQGMLKKMWEKIVRKKLNLFEY